MRLSSTADMEGWSRLEEAISYKEKEGSAIHGICSLNSKVSLPALVTYMMHTAHYLVTLRFLHDFCPWRCGALPAVAEFILGLLKVVVTVNRRKNIAGLSACRLSLRC